MSRILIVGGSGFIGQSIIKRCISLNWDIYTLNLHFHDLGSKYTNIVEIACDVRNLEDLKNAISKYEFTYVVNCLGYVDHSTLNNGGLNTIQTHFIGTVNLISALKKNSLKKFINIGSSDEYGYSTAPQVETLIEKPSTCYSFSKTCTSDFLKMMYISESFPSITLRIFLTYGPHQNHQRFIPQIINGCLSDSEFSASEGNQLRDFCFISDIVDAIFISLSSDINNAEIFNIASGNPVKVKDVILLIKKIIGKGFPKFGSLPYRANEIMELYADINKAKQKLNWSPKIGLLEGLTITIKAKIDNIEEC
jgi:nucleoside-diphosphate-sugar epimerase